MRSFILMAAVAAGTIISGQAVAQDAAAGEKVFGRCKACHSPDETTSKIGPGLKGIIGHAAAANESYKYSPAMVAAAADGLVWNDETMTEFLKNPKAMVKGTKMSFAGLKKDDEIANVIAYLKQFSD